MTDELRRRLVDIRERLNDWAPRLARAIRLIAGIPLDQSPAEQVYEGPDGREHAPPNAPNWAWFRLIEESAGAAAARNLRTLLRACLDWLEALDKATDLNAKDVVMGAEDFYASYYLGD